MATTGTADAEVHADTGDFKEFAAARVGFFEFDAIADF